MNLYIHNPNTISKQELKELQKITNKQTTGNNTIAETLETFLEKTEKKWKKILQQPKGPIDMYGQTINVGNYINYPVRKGSEISMRTAKVIQVRQRNDHLDRPEIVLDVAVAIVSKVLDQNVHIRRVTVSCPNRTTIIPESYILCNHIYKELLNV